MSSSLSKTIALIGAPTDVGAGDRGASMGPEAMRVAGLVEAGSIVGGELIADGNLIGVGEAVEVVGDASEIVLRTSGSIQHGLRRGAFSDVLPLHGDDGADRSKQDDGEWEPALHRYLMIVSLYLE